MTQQGFTFLLTDGNIVTIPGDILQFMTSIYRLLPVSSVSAAFDSPVKIPLTLPIYERIFEFLTYYLEDGLSDSKTAESTLDWERQFLISISDEIPQLLEAANFFGIHLLLNFLSDRLAESLKGKTAAAIRTMLQIQSDFTGLEDDEVELFVIPSFRIF
jgi:hypothetical protein